MRTLVLALLVLVPALPAAAQEQAHPRRARALHVLASPTTAVMIAPDRAWLAGASGEAPLSVCAGERCAPVRSTEACEAPRCPGSGRMVVLDRRIADVSDYPTDRDGMNREAAVMAQDAVLGQLSGWIVYQQEPPRTPPPEWGEGVRWELAAGVGASYLAHTGVGTGELTISGGARFHIDWGTSDDDDFFGVLMGDWLGADLRVHVLPHLRGQTFDEYAVAVGVGPVFSSTPDDEIVRLPSVWGVLIPEVGLIASGGRDVALYMQWSAAVAVLLDEHAAVEARASFMMIDDWVEGDPVEGILGLSVALVIR